MKLERNCSNPTAINVLQASFVDVLSSVHVLTLWVVIITQSSFTYAYVIIDQSPYREFYHTSRYLLAGILHNSRYYLLAHFGQIEILTNRFHFAARLFSYRSQMTSKCGKNKKVAHEPLGEWVTDVLTAF